MTKFTITFLSLLTVTACKKSEDNKQTGDTKVTETKADTKADTRADTKAAPSSDGKCADGAFYQPTGKFCIKLPAVLKGDGGPGREVGRRSRPRDSAGPVVRRVATSGSSSR